MPTLRFDPAPRLQFQRGWATDLPRITDFLTHLLDAKNVVYNTQGSVLKRPGNTNYNSSVLQVGGTNVKFTGIFDYWKHGTAGSAVQKYVTHVDDGSTGYIYKDDGDGTWDDISGSTTFEAGKFPSYNVFEDTLIMANNSTTDVPQTWAQSGNIANLGGTPPNFAFSVTHVNRVWAAGDAANPSRLYYSATLDGADWTGGDTGSIDIDPEDGDIITGLVSHRDELIVFKGPYKLSIHRLQGKTVATFSRLLFTRGVGTASHNSIISANNDVAFVDANGIHSLAATEKFGDFSESLLSKDIQDYFRNHIHQGELDGVWGTNWASGHSMLWTFTRASGSVPDLVIGVDYAFNPPWMFYWRFPGTTGVYSMDIMINQSKKRVPFLGLDNGFMVEGDRSSRDDWGNAIAAIIETPFMHFGDPLRDKSFEEVSQYLIARGDHNITLDYTIDENDSSSTTIPQSPNVFILGTSLLGTGKLGSANALLRHADSIEGEGRTIKLKYTQTGLQENIELLEIIPSMVPGDIRMD